MPAIQIGARVLALAGNSKLALERNSPLLSAEGETGSTSQVFQLPKTPPNDQTLGFPNRFDQAAGQPPQLLDVTALDDMGNGITTGNLRYRGTEPSTHSYNLEFGDSAVMARLKSRSLQSFRFGGPRFIADPATALPNGPYDPQAITAFMDKVVKNYADYDFTFAPFSNDDAAGRWKSYIDAMEDLVSSLPGSQTFTPTHIASFNSWSVFFNSASTPGELGFSYPLNFTIPGSINLQFPTLPEYQPCPLPKLEYIVRAVFDELQLPLETDVFDSLDMQRVVMVPVTGIVGYAPRPGSTGPGDNTPIIYLAQHMPALDAAKFVRQLMDTFGWHFDVAPNGICRLLKAAPLVLTGDPVDITTLCGPAFTIEQQEPKSILALPSWSELDAYAQEFSEQPAPAAILQPVATVADLPGAATADMYRLVQAERRYYYTQANTTTSTTNGTTTTTTTITWQPGPFYNPGQLVGSADEVEEYSVGITGVLTYPVEVQTAATKVKVPLLCFLEPSYTLTQAELTATQTSQAGAYLVDSVGTRSQSLRLANFFGLQEIDGLDLNGKPALIPWLTQGNLSPKGTLLGDLSLEVHGKYGLTQQCLLPLLAMKQAQTLVKMPAYFSAYQFTRLDFSRMLAIRGDEFMARRLSLSVPVTGPGQLELIPRGQVEHVSSRPAVSDGFFVSSTAPALTCTLLITLVQRPAADTAEIVVSQAQGNLLYQLDAGAPQQSNKFTGLVAGTSYTFWVYDLGVTRCHRSTQVTW